MELAAVLKVGGSLGRDPGLAVLCQEIGRLGNVHRLLVVPGGGEFADQVRTAYQRFHFGETTAHRMALLAMDQYGYLLSELIPDSVLVHNLFPACEVASAGRVPVLLPAGLVNQEDTLPHSWQVTSDTIAAWVAQTAGCSRLILLKVIDGISTSLPAACAPCNERTVALISECGPSDLAGHTGEVDEYLSTFLASTRLETWVINGRKPDRLAELLDSGHTLGTWIKPGGIYHPVSPLRGGAA